MRYAYPYELTPQPGGGYTVTFPDVSEAITEAETHREAAERAEDALVTALSFYTGSGQTLPSPSPPAGRPVAMVPSLVAAKLALHDAMLEAGASSSELARRLGVSEKAVRRLRDPLHQSHIGKVELALRALGRRLDVLVREDAG